MSALGELIKKKNQQSAIDKLIIDKAQGAEQSAGIIDTIGERFKRGVVGSAKGIADAGYVYGGIGDGNTEAMDKILEESTPSKQYTYKDVIPFESDFYTNPEGLAGTIAEQAGSTATLATAEAIARPIVKSYLRSKGVETAGIMAGLPTAVGAVLTRFTPTAGNSTVKNVAEKVIDKLANPLGAELVAEAGSTAKEVLDETGSMDEAREAGIKKAIVDAPVSALTNLIQSATARKALSGTGNKALNVAVGSATGLVEEVHQTHSERFAKGEIDAVDAFNPAEWNEEAKTAGVMGAIGGAGMQGVAVGAGKLADKVKQADMTDTEAITDAEFREADFQAEETEVQPTTKQEATEAEAQQVEAVAEEAEATQQPQNILRDVPDERLKALAEKVQSLDDTDGAKLAIMAEMQSRGIASGNDMAVTDNSPEIFTEATEQGINPPVIDEAGQVTNPLQGTNQPTAIESLLKRVQESPVSDETEQGIETPAQDFKSPQNANLAVSEGDMNSGEAVSGSVSTAKERLGKIIVTNKEHGLWEAIKSGTVGKWWKKQKRELIRDWVDKNVALKDVDNAIESAMGRKLNPEERTYDKAQMADATAQGTADALIFGNRQNVSAVNKRMQNVKMKWNVSLQTVFDELRIPALRKQYADYPKSIGCNDWQQAFSKYLGWRRLAEMCRLQREAFDEDMVAYLKGETRQMPKFADYQYTLPEVDGFQLTEADLLQGIAEAPPTFEKAAKVYYLLNDNLLSIMEDAGILTPELHQMFNTKFKEYCPLMRSFETAEEADNYIISLSADNTGYGNISPIVQRISEKGDSHYIISPLESTMRMVAAVVNRAERNKVAQHIVRTAQGAGLTDIIQEVDNGGHASKRENIFTVMFDGVKHAYQTTPELYKPIAGYDAPPANFVLNMAKLPARTLRAGATMSPSFILRNGFRDTLTAGINSDYGFIPFVDTFKGAEALLRNPELKALYDASGVSKFNFYGSNKEILGNLNKLAGTKNWQEMTPTEIAVNVLKYIPDKFEGFSNFVESATRMGEFKRAYEATGDADRAGYAAKNVTVNFGRSGAKGRVVNQYVPFFNAAIQGMATLVDVYQKNPQRTMANIGAYIVLPSMVLWAINKKWNAENYDEIEPSMKYGNWIIGDFKLPKPQDVGVLFGGGVEAMLDLAWEKNPKVMGEWLDKFLSTMIPNIFPTVILPLWEWNANYSLYRGKPLVNQRLQRLLDEKQYTPYTSEISKLIGKTTGTSPIKIDNLWRGYTGTMGMFLWQASMDWTGKGNNPAKDWSELPFFRDFNVNDIDKSKAVNEFYTNLRGLERQHKGYGENRKPSEALKSMRKYGKRIGKLNSEIRNITENATMTPEQKQKAIKKRSDYRRKLAKEANEAFNRYANERK